MIRKLSIGAVLAIGMVLTTAHGSSLCSRLATSVEHFHQYFDALKSAGDSVGPLQRFAFSLVMASSDSQPEKAAAAGDRI
jgi:hypothetical protein